MCNLGYHNRLLVRNALICKFIPFGRSFTGHDVYREVKKTLETEPGFPAQEVSAYVRELFNHHDEVFKGWACYPCTEPGPLVFFKAPKRVREKEERILALIKG